MAAEPTQPTKEKTAEPTDPIKASRADQAED
jgi:hypothetical protein